MIFENNAKEKLKVLGVGKAGVMLDKYFSLEKMVNLANSPIDHNFWLGTNVGVIVAFATEENSWEVFQKEVTIAREHNVITFPIYISEKYPDVIDNIIVINPKHFLREDDIYAYIEDIIKSIDTFISQSGCIDENLDDLRSLFNGNGRVAFSCYECKANVDRYHRAQNALQMKAIVGSPITDAKVHVWIITSSENNIRNMDLPDLIEELHSKLNNDCAFIWTAISDDTLTDGFRIYSWLKF
ncbi:hypothetical protein [Selenomonas ruminantium]|uniref:hypothetical protein n=1 Tax=Selenomonas ruminantium TaxID=971 RepID=UPI0026F21F88|nr:hypothetical protein [Selenomonas ruminantium]